MDASNNENKIISLLSNTRRYMNRLEGKRGISETGEATLERMIIGCELNVGPKAGRKSLNLWCTT